MSRDVTAYINLDAFRHNLQQIGRFAPDSKIMAVIKANAYGHGSEQIAEILDQQQDIHSIAVACLPEALQLRDLGIKKTIVVLQGVRTIDDVQTASLNNIQVVVHHQLQLDLLQKILLVKPLQVWVKVDTGMHRLGLCGDHIEEHLKQLQAVRHLSIVGLMSHLACADDTQSHRTEEQLTRFDELIQKAIQLQPELQFSIAASAGMLAWSASRYHWVRPGIALYGASPVLGKSATDWNLQAVMTLKAEVMAVRSVSAGECIGYGASYCCERASTIAVVGIGYGDGYPRHVKSGTPVLIRDKRAPLVGRVSMDMITVDVTDHNDVKMGDEVILWGDGLSVDEIADWADTISYELLCHVTRRVNFVYVEAFITN